MKRGAWTLPAAEAGGGPMPFSRGHSGPVAAALQPAAVLFLLLPVAQKAIETQQRALGDGLGAGLGVQAGDAGAVGDDSSVLEAPPPQKARQVGGEGAHLVDGKLARLAEPGDDDARRRDLAQRMDQGELAQLAAHVAGGDERADGAAHRPVDGAGGAAGPRDALEEAGDDGGSGEGAGVGGLDLDLHVYLPP